MSLREVQLTPWMLDNDAAITKSSVEEQDNFSLEDWAENPKSGNFLTGLTNTGLQALSQTYYGQVEDYIKGELGKVGSSEDSIRPVRTVGQSADVIGVDFRSLKNDKYKNVKLSSKLGQYNSMMNMLGTASGLFVGTLGKSLAGNATDDALGQFLQSLPFGSLSTNAGTIVERIVRTGVYGNKKESTSISTITPSWEDLISLTAANYYTILSYKPGLTIRSYGDRLEHITGKNGNLRLETEKEKEKRELNSQRTKLDRDLIVSLDRKNYDVDVDEVIETRDAETPFTPNKEKIGLDDAAKIDENIKRPSNLIEYATGLFSNTDPILANEENLEIQHIVTNPNKDNLEQEINSAKDLLKERQLKVVEYITNENTPIGDDNTIGLISEENLNELKENYKFFSAERDSNGRLQYNTNTKLTGTTLNANLTGVKNQTVINSLLRKEVSIEAKNNGNISKNITGYENPFNDDEEKNYTNGNFGRIAKADIYNRVNSKFRRIGGLYIEPFFNGGALKSFEIPFEFNPTITESGSVATYSEENVMGRILKLRSYVSSDAPTVTINAKYFVTADDDAKLRNDRWLNGWMSDWTVEKLRKVENQFRSLTLPYISDANFVRPPIVRIKMRSIAYNTAKKDRDEETAEAVTVGDLFRYPSVENKIQITSHFESKTRDKRYVVTNVTVAPLDSSKFGTSYGYHDLNERFSIVKRNGFEVTLTLAETTKNFLDLIPNYYEYTKGMEEDELVVEGDDDMFIYMPAEKPDLSSCLNQNLFFDTKKNIRQSKAEHSSDGTIDNSNKKFHAYAVSDYWYYIHEDKSNLALYYPINPPRKGELSKFLDSAFNGLENKVSLMLAYNEEETGISAKSSEEVDVLYMPEKNTSKTSKEYIEALEKDGQTIPDIIHLLKGTSWENNMGYNDWLWNGGNGFKDGWLKYYEILKKEYTDVEILKNLGDYWRNDKTFKEWLVNSTNNLNSYYLSGLDFGSLLQITADVETGIATILRNFKGSYYDQEGSKYLNWLTGKNGNGTYKDSRFPDFYTLYNCFERAGYSDDDIDYLLYKTNWGSYESMLNGSDRGYWETFGENKTDILLRRMTIAQWLKLYEARNGKNYEEAVRILATSTAVGKYISNYKELMDEMYADGYKFSLSDPEKNILELLKNYYDDGTIRYLLENTDFAENFEDYNTWITNQRPERKPIEYSNDYTGYQYFSEPIVQEEVNTDGEEDNSDLEDIEFINDWDKELINANQMFEMFFKNSDDENKYVWPVDTTGVGAGEDDIIELMKASKDTNKQYRWNGKLVEQEATANK